MRIISEIVVVVFRRKASIKGNHTERENVIDKELSRQTTMTTYSQRGGVTVLINNLLELELFKKYHEPHV